jgi:hypothetical protein
LKKFNSFFHNIILQIKKNGNVYQIVLFLCNKTCFNVILNFDFQFDPSQQQIQITSERQKNKRQKPCRYTWIYLFFSFRDFFEKMAPNYREEEIAQNLNNIFAEDNKNVTISNIKSPTGDFTREIIIAALKESGFNLGKDNHSYRIQSCR